MTQRTPVAVVVPVYNRRLKLIKTLESITAQTALPALLVVVDDGSTDRTAEAARNWLADNARFEWRVIEQPNAGASAARNAGFAHIGQLPFVCFLDSDDLWPPNFIAAGLQALETRQDAVAAVSDKVKERRGRRQRVQRLHGIQSNAVLWLIFNGGAILSCTMIRSSAARAAGLFTPGMIISEDTDFLLRLFLLGGAAHSKAAPVVFVKETPLEATEASNLSKPSLELKYQWASQLTTLISNLPHEFMEKNERLIRTAVAHKWASVAFSSAKAQNRTLALKCLLQAMWWDYDGERRLRLMSSFLRGRKGVLAYFPNPFADIKGAES